MFKVLAIVGLAALASAAPKDDLVTTLDQFPDISFGLYSGYIQIPDTSKQLHYMAALSQNDPTKDPVILWFNGGPGCSSMLGFATEHGPYVIEDGTDNFVRNDYAWNNEATVIYLESPAGVGYSVCGKPEECNFNDNNTADDNLQAVLGLFQNKFPEFQTNDFWIAGESYAGIYVPKLAAAIDKYNSDNINKTDVFKPNLKGILVGNGVTNYKYDCTPAFFEMSYWFGLIDDILYHNIKNNCDLTYMDITPSNLTDDCNNWLGTWQSLVEQVNIYDLFGKCYTNPSQMKVYETKQDFFLKETSDAKVLNNFYTASEYTPFLNRNFGGKKNLKVVPPCVYAKPILDFLNNATNKANLHIPDTVQAWDLCSDTLNYTKLPEASYDIYPTLKGKYKILKFSGDTDGAVPTMGTQGWINAMNWTVTKEWAPYMVGGQVGGYVEVRDGLTFATVHGAGHMAPQWKRPQTYHVIFNFIQGKDI